MSSLPWRPPRSAFAAIIVSHRLSGARGSADGGEMSITAQDGLDGALRPDAKHDDRHTVFPGKREGRRIHDFKVFLQRFLVAEPVVSGGAGIALGIGRIDAVDVSRLENGIAAHFGGAQNGGRVGGEVRVAGAPGEYD